VPGGCAFTLDFIPEPDRVSPPPAGFALTMLATTPAATPTRSRSTSGSSPGRVSAAARSTPCRRQRSRWWCPPKIEEALRRPPARRVRAGGRCPRARVRSTTPGHAARDSGVWCDVGVAGGGRRVLVPSSAVEVTDAQAAAFYPLADTPEIVIRELRICPPDRVLDGCGAIPPKGGHAHPPDRGCVCETC
jgi:hypothetical protein